MLAGIAIKATVMMIMRALRTITAGRGVILCNRLKPAIFARRNFGFSIAILHDLMYNLTEISFKEAQAWLTKKRKAK